MERHEYPQSPVPDTRMLSAISDQGRLSFSVTARQRGIQRESPSNLTNAQETGKIFQRKIFHVLTVFFRLVRRFLLDPSLGQLVLVPALRSEVAPLIL